VKTYKAGQPPSNPADLPGFLLRELPAIEQAANRADPYAELQVLAAVPQRVRKGMLVVAGATLGATGDFGYGAGLYLRNEANDAWLFIVSLSSLLALANTWTAKQTFSNYTVLGAGPAIKMKKLTGTTGAGASTIASVAHGLDSEKILGLQVLVFSARGGFENRVPPGKAQAGYGELYYAAVDPTDLVLFNGATEYTNIESQPFTVLITYEE
jgi:hypothetical protein